MTSRKATTPALVEMYEAMVRIRRFEETIHIRFLKGTLPGTVHLYHGQEAVAVGACSNLRVDDVVTSTHRPHGHAIAKGVPLKSIMAELYGKETGCCRGKGGSMHIGDASVGMLPAIAIVGGGFTVAAGCALAFKMQDSPDVSGFRCSDGLDPSRAKIPKHQSLTDVSGFGCSDSQSECTGKTPKHHRATGVSGFRCSDGLDPSRAKIPKHPRVAVSFFGDGATNEGDFHEGLNMAAIWNLPVVYICENNLYGASTRVNLVCRLENLADRAASYGMPSAICDGNDVEAVHAAVKEAVDRARSGIGPTLVECKTYRIGGHSRSDANAYRDKDEEKAWFARDPLIVARDRLGKTIGFTDADAARVEEQIAREIEEATQYAENSPLPSPDECLTDLWAV